MIDALVSEATKKNWKRLGLNQEEISKKLSSRANKLNSIKRFIPKEYLKNKKNSKCVEDIVNYSLQKNLSIDCVIYNLALNLLELNNLIKFDNNVYSENKYLLEILNNFSDKNIDKYLLSIDIPHDEEDFLGIIYQSLMSEGNKNKKGSYYTPKPIIDYLLNDLKKEDLFLDPCCGTGSFLISASKIVDNPEKIFGFDIDNVACFISKINLIIFFKDKMFNPNVYNFDFMSDKVLEKFKDKKFDFISTNPPWGAKFKNINSEKLCYKESFSLCIFQSKNLLKNNGFCSFLLPKSILNIKAHKNIREYILENFFVQEIKMYGKPFSGVLTDVISLKLSKNLHQKDVKIIENKIVKNVCVSAFKENKNKKFMLIDNKDLGVIKHVFNIPHTNLKKSIWGLGIVTGNNPKYISNTKSIGEKIYTGKEISKYNILDTNRYINYDRKSFQQTAPDAIYRADEKLVYKFISRELVFAYDNEKKLFLNSANILIPRVDTHSVFTVMAFLNSKLFSYLYKIMFDDLKILRGNLEELPFPLLDKKVKKELENYVKIYLKNKDNETLKNIDNIVFKAFDLNKNYTKIIDKN